MVFDQCFDFLLLETEDSRRQVPSDGANAESLEKYKSDNKSLVLQVSKWVFLNSEIEITVLLLILICP